MKSKVCFKCNIEKPLSDYYKHKQMGDGHLNKCIECTRLDSRNQYDKNIQNEEWVEKERFRNKERRIRLNYTEKKRNKWDVGKPWRDSSVYKGLRKKYYENLKNIYKLHHWNYNDEFLKDVFIMKSREHRLLHNHLILDIEKRIFYLDDGTYLDTREKHEEFIKSMGFFIGRVEDMALYDNTI